MVCVNDHSTYGPASCAEHGSLKLTSRLGAWLTDVTQERIVCLGHCQNVPHVSLVPADFVTSAELSTAEPAIKKRLIARSSG